MARQGIDEQLLDMIRAYFRFIAATERRGYSRFSNAPNEE